MFAQRGQSSRHGQGSTNEARLQDRHVDACTGDGRRLLATRLSWALFLAVVALPVGCAHEPTPDAAFCAEVRRAEAFLGTPSIDRIRSSQAMHRNVLPGLAPTATPSDWNAAIAPMATGTEAYIYEGPDELSVDGWLGALRARATPNLGEQGAAAAAMNQDVRTEVLADVVETAGGSQKHSEILRVLRGRCGQFASP